MLSPMRQKQLEFLNYLLEGNILKAEEILKKIPKENVRSWINTVKDEDNTPLLFVLLDHYEFRKIDINQLKAVFDLLIKYHIDFNVWDGENSFLHYALSINDPDIFELIFFSLDLDNKEKLSAIRYLIESNCIELIKKLLELDINLASLTDDEGNTPLHWSVKENNYNPN